MVFAATVGAEPGSRVASFTAAMGTTLDDSAIVDQYVLHGSCYAIQEEQHYALKREVAHQFNLEVSRDIFVVGSAKLGFSIAPNKRYRYFGDRSDIDIAIVSHDLYQKVWHEVHSYAESGADWPRRESCEGYLAWGWIRPDKLPSGRSFTFASEWWEFFRALQRGGKFGPYKVAAGLYHDIEFLRRYQMRAVGSCRTALIEEN
ncbi:hypothetical protein [Micromonospora sp. RP3T]|uniref:hypothetical protein n=1 Tax=Micromonospora sp. RP3T TaxID=2135446 RepID=UPI0011B2719D|nr:hypothetical protein [Micromonospora sp. RP3T]